MTFNDDELTALQSGMLRIGIFFRLETDPIVRLWLGAGKIQPGVSAFDPEGEEYIGFGEIQNVPAMKQLLNGAAERVEFTLSGVAGSVLAVASGDDANQVKGKPVSVGFGLMNSSWAMMGDIHRCANYTADFLSISQTPADALQPIVRSIVLSCGTRFTGRWKPSLSYFSDQDQQTRSPGDLFCALVGRYAHGFNKAWPQFS